MPARSFATTLKCGSGLVGEACTRYILRMMSSRILKFTVVLAVAAVAARAGEGEGQVQLIEKDGQVQIIEQNLLIKDLKWSMKVIRLKSILVATGKCH